MHILALSDANAYAYRTAVDGEDASDSSRLNVERLGQLRQKDVEVAGAALVEQLAYDVTRTRSGSDHEDRFVPRWSELGRLVLARLVCITAEPPLN